MEEQVRLHHRLVTDHRRLLAGRVVRPLHATLLTGPAQDWTTQVSEDAEGVVSFRYRTQPDDPPDVQTIQKQMAIVAWQPGPNRIVQVPDMVPTSPSGSSSLQWRAKVEHVFDEAIAAERWGEMLRRRARWGRWSMGRCVSARRRGRSSAPTPASTAARL